MQGNTEDKKEGISSVFIKHPVTTVMLSLALIVLGIIGFVNMGVDLYPNVDIPYVSVQTILKGSSPEEIETSITKKVEESSNVVAGIDDIHSTTLDSVSVVILSFEIEKNPDVAAQEIRDKVNQIQRDLPEGIESPIVQKVDLGASAIATLVVSGDEEIIPLTEIARKQVKENIENISGVGTVEFIGGREREIHIVVDPQKLSSLGLPIALVKKAIMEQNIEVPGGSVENKKEDFNLRILGRLGKVEDFSNIVLANINGTQIKISDIGRVEDSGEREISSVYLNGKRGIGLAVKKQSGTNTLAVIKAVQERVKILEPLLPEGIKIDMVSDQSSYIEESFWAVMEHLIVGAILAAIVVFLFMGDTRSTLIAALAIPVSIIGTFFFMKQSGFTLNNMTLLGLTVAVGIVIDDAIIMLENIHRHMLQYKKTAFEAAISGSKEIFFAVLSTTASLIVIFVPLSFMTGIVGRYVKSYGLTVAFAIAISGIVALTLTPMLCSKFLKPEMKHKDTVDKVVNKVNDIAAKNYTKGLTWALGHKMLMIIFSLLLVLSPILFAKLGWLGADFLPEDDTSRIQINLKAPDGTSYQNMKNFTDKVEKEIFSLPYITKVFNATGISANSIVNTGNATNNAYFLVELAPLKERSSGYSAFDYVDIFRKILSKYEGVTSSVFIQSDSPISGLAKVQYVITGPDFNKLYEYANKIYDKVIKEKGVIDLEIDFNLTKPEYRIIIDRDKAHDLGVSLYGLATTLRTFVSGEENISKYKENGELYEIRIRAEEEYRNNPAAISSLMIPAVQNGKNTLVRLDSIAEVEKGFGPSKIERYNRQRQITINANIVEGQTDMQTVIREMDKVFKSLNPPATYNTAVLGQSKEMKRMLSSFITAFILAIIFMYMILASQFESYVFPLVILTAIPLTIPFALISLVLTRENLNVFSLLGLFMLGGIVTKNAILQVDYTNTLRSKGLEKYKALIEANKVRLRPILMTTVTIIVGMIPTALGTGAGSGLRRSLAIVIIGGQGLALLITLLMVPVVYAILDDFSFWFKRKILKQSR